MAAQSQRLNVVASNIANAESTDGPDGKPYRAQQVEFMAAAMGSKSATGVKVSQVVEDASPAKKMYNPSHPKADDKGYVDMPNVNVVDEMVNMLSASRSYQTNVDIMNAAKSMLTKTLSIGQ